MNVPFFCIVVFTVKVCKNMVQVEIDVMGEVVVLVLKQVLNI